MTTEVNNNTARPRINSFTEGLQSYSIEQREKMQWLWGYYHGPLQDSKSRLCAELGMDWEKISRAFSGKLATRDIDDFILSVDNLKNRTCKDKPLVDNIVSRQIIDALNYCRDNSAMIYISGTTGRGKTYTSEYWAMQNNHGRTKFLRIPSDCSRRALVRLMCKVCGVPCRGNTVEMEENLKGHINPTNVIIIDEAGHLLRSGASFGAIEFLRDLHDTCRCGIALIFTDVYLKTIKNGPNADYFEQFRGRLEYKLEIPATPRRDEVRSVVSAYISDPDEKIVSYALEIARQKEGKMRTLFTDLHRADQFAKYENSRITLTHLKKAVGYRQAAGAWPEDN